ncbi:MAG: RIP metalloprotease RseP, partial [Acidobacteriales bacterium]|nr:RIP metalloprotease RseP [Terriglobales bacterium]
GQPLEVMVQRGDHTLPITLTPHAVGKDKHGVAGWEPPLIVDVEPDNVAMRAGMQRGDQIAAFNGTPVGYSLTDPMTDFITLVQNNKDKPAELTVVRNGQVLNFKIAPVLSEVDGETRYRLGVRAFMHVDKLPISKAFAKSVEKNQQFAGLIVVMVKKLVQQKVSIKQISGPVGIGQAAGDAFREEGWLPLIFLTALISINLGIFNLFPIPILDGGMILMLMIEGLMRRDIKREIKERVYQAAFVFLVIFAVVVIYNDLSKLPGIGRFLP